MPTYRVPATVTISMFVDVQAESIQEAWDLAERAPMMSLCHQCCRAEPGQWSTSGEIDGEPEIDRDPSQTLEVDE